MKKRSYVLAIIVSGLLALEFGCSKSSDVPNNNNNTNTSPDCSSNNPSFSAAVLPLVQSKCATNSDCHASGSTTSGGPFTTYAQISAKASTIRTQVASGAMPQNGSLTTAEKNTIICWVNNGAANN